MLIAFFVLAGSFVLAGCGDPYDVPLLAGTESPSIRVLLGKSRKQGNLQLARQSWDARSLGGRAYARKGHEELKTLLQVGRSGILFRGVDTGATSLRIRCNEAFQLDGATYGGDLIVHRVGAGGGAQLQFINELDLETYVAGVIGNEVGPNAKSATYRAQAVTARTYAYIRLSRADARRKPYHLFDDARSQVYRGRSPRYGVPYREMVQATRATRGVILTWESRPFPAYYSSTCGGHTTDAATSQLDPQHAGELLRGVPCRWCKTSKYFEWPPRVVGDDKLIASLRRIKRPVKKPIHDISVRVRGRGGWAAKVRIVHGPARTALDISGPEFRRAAGIRSHNIDSIKHVSGGWRIAGRGWGHGVGMCQWGAIEMGKAGASETEILRYYYPGVAFTKVY